MDFIFNIGRQGERESERERETGTRMPLAWGSEY